MAKFGDLLWLDKGWLRHSPRLLDGDWWPGMIFALMAILSAAARRSLRQSELIPWAAAATCTR